MKWRTIKFGEFAEVQPRISLNKGEEYPHVPMEIVEPYSRQVQPITTKIWNGSGVKFQNGDTIFARITPCLENGKTAQIKSLERNIGFGSTEFYVFRGKIGISDSDFVYYLARSNIIRDPAIKSMVGSSGRQRAQKKVIEEIVVTVPSIDSQREIASILSAYDNLIENNQRRIELLEQSARLLYKEWFVNLRFPGHEHAKVVDGVPEGWNKGVVSDFYETSSGGTPSRKNPDFYTGDINWVKTQELNEDFIFETEEKITEEAIKKSSAKLFSKNTVLISIYGGTNIGRTGILANPAATNQACCALLPKDSPVHFIFTALFFHEHREKLISLAQGAAQTNISQQVIRSLPFFLPSKSLMNIFIETLAPSFDKLKNLKLQNQKLCEARDILLPKLMNGEIVV